MYTTYTTEHLFKLRGPEPSTDRQAVTLYNLLPYIVFKQYKVYFGWSICMAEDEVQKIVIIEIGSLKAIESIWLQKPDIMACSCYQVVEMVGSVGLWSPALTSGAHAPLKVLRLEPTSQP